MSACQHHQHCSGHDHAAHADFKTADGRRRVAIAGVLTALFMVAEVVGGVISGSLALLADAAHMLTDTASLALAWQVGHLINKVTVFFATDAIAALENST